MHGSKVCLLIFVLSAFASASPCLGQERDATASLGPRFLLVMNREDKAPVEVDASAIPLLQRRITLQLEGVSRREALAQVSRASGLRLIYADGVVPRNGNVRLRADEITVAAALTDVLLGTGIDLVVTPGGSAVLVRRPLPAQPGSVSGRVTDAKTGEPLIGATVSVVGTTKGASADNDGRYRIDSVAPGTYTLRARYIGYAPLSASVVVESGQEVTADFALQRSAQQLDELVTVTPGGMQAQVRAVPTPLTIITAADIERQQPRNTQQLIRQAVPTAIAWDVPASPTFTPFSVRGASTLNGSSAMKVFVDGIEVSDFLFAPVDPQSIERIEVIHGPQAAAVYGSDALGGVVQVYTKRGDSTRAGPLVRAQTELGAIQTPYAGFESVLRQKYAASIHGGARAISYNFGGGFSHSGDYLPGGEISRQSAPSAYGGMQYSSDNFTADVFGRYFTNKTPDVFDPQLAATGFFFFTKPNFQPSEITNQSLGTRLTFAPLRGWENILRLGVDRNTVDREQTRPRLTTPADTLLSVFNSQETKRSIAYSAVVRGPLGRGLAGSITAGVDHYSLPASAFSASSTAKTRGVIDNAGLPIFASRVVINNTGYFAQGELGIRDALFLTAGLRAESNSEFGDSLGTPVSPRFGASVVQEVGAATIKVRGSWGRGIRAPAPGQKGANVSSFQIQLPNPLLGPERQEGWDAGVDAIFGSQGSLSVTWYDQRATNLIDFVQLSPTPVPTVQFQNVARVRNMGVEVEGRLMLGRIQLNGQYGYTRSRVDELGPSYAGDLRPGDQALQTPKHTAGGGLSVELLPRTTLTGGVTYVGSWNTYDNFALFSCFGGTGPCRPSNRDYIVRYPGFAKINASILHSVTSTFTAFLSVENLTNNEAHELGNGQPVFGRITTLGLRFQQ